MHHNSIQLPQEKSSKLTAPTHEQEPIIALVRRHWHRLGRNPIVFMVLVGGFLFLVMWLISVSA